MPPMGPRGRRSVVWVGLRDADDDAGESRNTGLSYAEESSFREEARFYLRFYLDSFRRMRDDIALFA